VEEDSTRYPLVSYNQTDKMYVYVLLSLRSTALTALEAVAITARSKTQIPGA
jgi:hypothetical protein